MMNAPKSILTRSNFGPGQPRRQFLATMATVCSAVAVSQRATARQLQAGLRIRKNASKMAANDANLMKYAAAVKAMHQLPATDRRNWRQQAEIHPKFCHNAGAIFLPWHRHYLNQFEKICGALIGDSSFAIPYWDWTEAGGRLPDAFFDVDELNVTFWNDNGVGNFPNNWGPVNTRGTRGLAKGDRPQDDPQRGGNFTSTRIGQIMNSTTYNLFSNQLESSPHNSGHVVVGIAQQNPMGHMLSGLSPLDPIFWLHHCNCDRLWAEWQLAGNSTPPFGQQYDGQFADDGGSLVDLDADDSTNFESLGYSYDTIAHVGSPTELLQIAGVPVTTALAPTASTAPEPTALFEKSLDVALTANVPFSIDVSLDGLDSVLSSRHEVRTSALPSISALEAFGGSKEEALAGFGELVSLRRNVYAIIEGFEAPANSALSVNVFLNCPYLTPQTSFRDRHFAGSFSFFGHEHPSGQHGDGNHMKGKDFVVDITDVIERLGVVDQSNLKVQLLPLSPLQADSVGPITVKSIKIVYT